jgi:hypothetical protein
MIFIILTTLMYWTLYMYDSFFIYGHLNALAYLHMYM